MQLWTVEEIKNLAKNELHEMKKAWSDVSGGQKSENKLAASSNKIASIWQSPHDT